MIIAVPKETFPGEKRVALVPANVPELTKAEHEVRIEAGAGLVAGYTDAEYEGKGAKIVNDRRELIRSADIILQVRGFGTNPEDGKPDLELFQKGQAVIGYLEPLAEAEHARTLARTGVISYAMELIPRITRAQSMDALSSMANIAGYKIVLLAAAQLPKMFPMMMTAAGTIAPARVFVMGAGVAGLQAIATAKRLGAVVSAYDVRPVVKEQVESVGGKFIELELETEGAEDKGGYAREQSEEFLRKQREMMLQVIAENDIVITTAAIPGKKAPILVTTEMVKAMKPGSVIVDLAAERGGNCELTRAGETVEVHGVTILGPVNISSSVAYHASQMYSKNIVTLLTHLLKDGKLESHSDDEIEAETMVTHGGEVVNNRVREALGLEPIPETKPGIDSDPEPPGEG